MYTHFLYAHATWHLIWILFFQSKTSTIMKPKKIVFLKCVFMLACVRACVTILCIYASGPSSNAAA